MFLCKIWHIDRCAGKKRWSEGKLWGKCWRDRVGFCSHWSWVFKKKNERNINNRSQKDALSLIHVELVRQSGRSFVVGAAYLHKMPLYFINSIAFENEKKVQFINKCAPHFKHFAIHFYTHGMVLPLCILVIYSLDMSKTISHFSYYFTSCSLRVTHTHSLACSLALSLAICVFTFFCYFINDFDHFIA